MKKISAFLLFSLCLALALTGCSYQIQQARVLNPATEFNRANLADVKVDAVAAPDKLPPPYTVVIRKPELDPSTANVPRAAEYADLLLQKVYDSAMIQNRKSFVLTTSTQSVDMYKSLGRRVYEVQSSITFLDPGKGWKRDVLGFGAGDVKIQWEGKIVNLEDNKTILRFVIGDRTNGDPMTALWDFRIISERYAVKKALEHLALKFITNVQPYL